MRSAVGNGLCRFVIGISCRTMLGCGPQMCSDVADLIRRSSGRALSRPVMRQGSRQVRHPVTFAGAVGRRPEKPSPCLRRHSSLVPTSTWPKALL